MPIDLDVSKEGYLHGIMERDHRLPRVVPLKMALAQIRPIEVLLAKFADISANDHMFS